jgi:putative flavoprotein involved in K+ transport
MTSTANDAAHVSPAGLTAPEEARDDARPTGPSRAAVVVVGAGQAGLATAHALRAAAIDCIVLDQGDRIGDAWRQRWDSLRLFTPAAYDALPGRPFPAAGSEYPTKDEMADYLETYVAAFALPVRLRTRVTRVACNGDGFQVEAADGGRWEAEAVVIATGGHQAPHVPELAGRIAPAVRQLHSSAYRDPSQLLPGPVLVVGAGNSGAEIAIESASTGHRTWLAGRSTGHIPSRAFVFNGRIMMFLARHLLTRDTPVGRRMAPRVLAHGGPLIRLAPADISNAGVTRVGRVVEIADGVPVVEGGERIDAKTIVWATGYRPELGWIEPSVIDAQGRVEQDRGIATNVEGLYFVGQPFQTGFTSALIDGAGRDATRVVRRIARRITAPAVATA